MNFKKFCYELYKIDWMRRISADRQMDSLKKYYLDAEMDTTPTSYEEVLEEFGFDGEMYVCYEEFKENEFKDKTFMKNLLDNDKLYMKYLHILDSEFPNQ